MKQQVKRQGKHRLHLPPGCAGRVRRQANSRYVRDLTDAHPQETGWLPGHEPEDNQLVDSAKAMTIRLTDEQADQLKWVAAVDEQSVTDVIRTAIAKHVEGRCKDEAFQKHLRERITRAQNLLDR